RDTMAPIIQCPSDILVPCAVDLLVPVSFAASATDVCDPSPTITYSVQTGSGFPVRTTTVICTATDASGNVSSCSFSVTRAPLSFAGFLPPIGGADTTGGSFANPVRTFKNGSTIPVKFTASCGGAAVLSGVHRLQAIQYSDANTAGEAIDASPRDGATSGNQFRLADGQWHFNLDTKATGMSVGIWQLVATLSDGSEHTVWIQLK
ncbi:MAG: PxKF domain-containing protein, partial [Verrucomicrobia bacterium]|nr:PxKF domain-containing protein [Verrucomicrobiota bacterium]